MRIVAAAAWLGLAALVPACASAEAPHRFVVCYVDAVSAPVEVTSESLERISDLKQVFSKAVSADEVNLHCDVYNSSEAAMARVAEAERMRRDVVDWYPPRSLTGTGSAGPHEVPSPSADRGGAGNGKLRMDRGTGEPLNPGAGRR